jgi:predicted metalloprotease with PDZ domain
VFDASRPARYLAVVISRFNPVESTQLKLTTTPKTDGDVGIYVEANPRQVGRARDMLEKTSAVFQFYASIVGDAPYSSFTLALTESDRPGGHSPPYFAVLNQVVQSSTFVWRNDPVSFDSYPTFFLAHELAHQWWGHAVGWKNYHEQWLSEGFAQYFAAMYADKERPGSVLGNLLRQMRHTAIQMSDQGPVYLGYRLGHIRGDDKVFRAIIYNKGAMVLHMLRRLLGDEQFFSGLRAFYAEWKFKKAGTDDFRIAMERVSGRDLNRFFETWIYKTDIPTVKFGYHSDGVTAKVQFEQRGAPVDVAITVAVTYTDGSSEDLVVVLGDRLTEQTIQLKKALRTITANADNGALVEVTR